MLMNTEHRISPQGLLLNLKGKNNESSRSANAMSSTEETEVDE